MTHSNRVKNGLSRRDFMKTTAVGAAGAAAAGATAGWSADPCQAAQTTDWLGQPPEIPPGAITETIDADVAVCGAGVGGLGAARAAAEAGARVVVLEPRPSFLAKGFQFGCINAQVFSDAGGYVDPDASYTRSYESTTAG